MKQKDGLKHYGSLMMKPNYQTPFDWIIESEWDNVSFVAPAELPWEYHDLPKLGINYCCYDIDPVYSDYEYYRICDPIFDPVDLAHFIVNFNAQKMYPIGKLYKGEFIIVGSDIAHNGDCNIITSCEQLIEQNMLHTVFDKKSIVTNRCTYHFVWGRND